MPVFKFVISDGKKSLQVEKDQNDAPIMNKKIGDVIQGNFLGLDGYELQITGGTDRDGFPMTKNVEGPVKKSLILTKGEAFNPTHPGLRKRKYVRGNTINQDIMQVNCKVTKKGAKSVEEALGLTKPTEGSAEESVPEAKKEVETENKEKQKKEDKPSE